MSASGRPARPVHVLTVIETDWLTPHLVRVWAGGDAVAAFADSTDTDRYVKIWFAKPALGLVPPFDIAHLRETLTPDDVPVTRTYSVPVVQHDRVAIDFVVHGDEGLAGPWAAHAQPGDVLAFSGPGGGYSPDPSADAHLFVGDESAIPAIGAALAWLAEHAPDARGSAYLETVGPDEVVELDAPAGIELVWCFRGDDPSGASVLADAVASHAFGDGRTQVFAHGERESMKAIRDVVKQHGIPREDLSLSGYWARGRTEDRFQAEKREPIGKIL